MSNPTPERRYQWKPTKENIAWRGMRARCHNPKHKSYARYGGAGITVCDEWRSSFKRFLSDVGLAPGPKFQLDRIDNPTGYVPGNFRWETATNNARNRKDNAWYTFEGVRKNLSAWKEDSRLACKPDTLEGRLRTGWSIGEALLTPTRTYKTA